jgi:cytochrome c-type biogenesis protein CcmE
MHPVRKQRLFIILFVIIFSSIAVLLMTYALRENINLFYPPSKIVAGEVPLNTRIRGGGCVVPGSIVRSTESLQIDFRITDGHAEVPVRYTGILPDLFAEGEAAVATGMIDDMGIFQATEVLAKHDETYMPPEVAEAMAQASQATGTEHQATCNKI